MNRDHHIPLLRLRLCLRLRLRLRLRLHLRNCPRGDEHADPWYCPRYRGVPHPVVCRGGGEDVHRSEFAVGLDVIRNGGRVAEFSLDGVGCRIVSVIVNIIIIATGVDTIRLLGTGFLCESCRRATVAFVSDLCCGCRACSRPGSYLLHTRLSTAAIAVVGEERIGRSLRYQCGCSCGCGVGVGRGGGRAQGVLRDAAASEHELGGNDLVHAVPLDEEAGDKGDASRGGDYPVDSVEAFDVLSVLVCGAMWGER